MNYQPQPIPLENMERKNSHAYDKAVISWIAPEYLEHPRGMIFYAITGSIIAFLIIYEMVTDGWSMVISCIALIGVYLVYTMRKPRLIEIKISDIGIKVGEKFYLFTHLKAFWLIYKPPRVKTLNIRTDNKLVGDLTIQLADQDPAEVRNFLLTQIPEMENKHETLADILSHFLRI